MGVLFNGVADIKRTFGFDIAYMRTLSECNAVHYVIRFIIHQLQLDVFLIAPYHFTSTIIINVMRTKYGFVISWSKRVELLQVTGELGVDVFEVYFSININHRKGLFGQNMFRYEFFKSSGKLGYLFNFH